MSKKISEELAYFIELLKIDETLEIITSSQNGCQGVWVIVDEADINLEIKYSSLYLTLLEKYPDYICDFMVFGKDEIKDLSFPIDAFVVYHHEEG